MKKHRYILPNCPPGGVDQLSRIMEDQGFEVLSVSIFMAQAGGGAGAILYPHAAVAGRIDREAPETELEKEAREQAESRIVKPFDGGVH